MDFVLSSPKRLLCSIDYALLGIKKPMKKGVKVFYFAVVVVTSDSVKEGVEGHLTRLFTLSPSNHYQPPTPRSY